MILILGRLCEPSSELHLAAHLYEASAMSDLLGVPEEKVNEDRLYRENHGGEAYTCTADSKTPSVQPSPEDRFTPFWQN